jgi:septin family protein
MDKIADQYTDTAQDLLPFAVVGSEKTVVVNGKNVRGRQTKWGVINGMFTRNRLLAHR